MRRFILPILITVLVTAAVAIGIGYASPSNAAVVNGTGLSESEVHADLEAVSSNNAYLCYLNAKALIASNGQSGLGSVNGASPGTWSSGFVTLWMNQEITRTLLHQQAEAKGIPTPSADDLQLGRTDLYGAVDSTLAQVAGSQFACPITAEALFKGMPKDFVDRQVSTQALSEAYLARAAGISLTPAAIRSYYNANPTSFDQICVSGVLLGSKAEADSTKTEIDAGGDFAAIASARSLDTASKARGGDLGCFDPTSSQYRSVQTDVGSLAIGEVSSPLASQSGSYVILKVTKRTTAPFAAISSIVRRTMLASAASKASTAMSELVADAHVTVNPAYGSWKASGALAGLVPPTSPPAASIPNASANQPGGIARPSSGGSSGASANAGG